MRVPLAILACSAAALGQRQRVYVAIGGSLVIDPKLSMVPTNILWKENGNLAAEYVKFKVPLTYYDGFENRTVLNTSTAVLTVSDWKKSDDTEFSVEIDNQVLPPRWRTEALKNLDDFPLEISVTPQNCINLTSGNCTLVCGGQFDGAEPVQYFWKKGATGEWKEESKKIEFSFTKETTSFPYDTCKAKNPVSEKESAPVQSTFNRQDGNDGQDNNNNNNNNNNNSGSGQTGSGGGGQTANGSSHRDLAMPSVLLLVALAVGGTLVV